MAESFWTIAFFLARNEAPTAIVVVIYHDFGVSTSCFGLFGYSLMGQTSKKWLRMALNLLERSPNPRQRTKRAKILE